MGRPLNYNQGILEENKLPDSSNSTIAVEDASGLTLQAWNAFLGHRSELGAANLAVQRLDGFLSDAERHPMRPEDKKKILDQATLMIDHLYPHLPYKLETFHFIHPVLWLETNVRPFLDTISEANFHGNVIAAFSLVRDAHTLYGLPSPFRGAVAFLPFQMRYYVDPAGRHYVVTKVMSGFDHEQFRPGAEITRWGGAPVDLYIQAIAGRLPGGNTDAHFTRGVFHSTLRPLTFCQPPSANELPAIVLEYTPPGSTETRSIRIPWGVATGFDLGHGFPPGAFSMSSALEHSNAWCSVLHSPPTAAPTPAMQPTHPVSPAAAALSLKSRVPEAFEMQFTGGAQREGVIDPANLVAGNGLNAASQFGYIKIKKFSDGSTVGNTGAIVDEFKRILGLMDQVAPDGLILDVRANPGGDVHAAEQMLQMLTPGKITPARFHLANTPAVVQILRNIVALAALPPGQRGLSAEDESRLTDAMTDLNSWLDDGKNQPLPEGQRVTSGQTLTESGIANVIGQVYQGRVVLLIDALTYSAAEIFAAGFQDHAIGTVIGMDHNTGGGGGNVWKHSDLLRMLGPVSGLALEELPLDATMSVAIRRLSRVGFFPGTWVEDVGVKADLPYIPDSADDLISDYPGLIRLACDTLLQMPKFRADVVKFAVQRDGSVKLDLATTNIDSIDVFLDGQLTIEKHQVSRSPDGSATAQSLTVPGIPGTSDPSKLIVVAYTLAPGADGQELFEGAFRKVDLQAPAPAAQEDEAPTDGTPDSQ